MQSTLDSFVSSPRSVPQPVSTSQEIRDRGSTFVAHIFNVASVKQAKEAIDHLRNVSHSVKPATHEISAWRCMVLKPDKNGLGGEDDFEVVSGHDDDGERYGGERVMKVMKSFGIIDAVVVVSRWYGGIMLGSARFGHIETCAEEVCRRFKLNEDIQEHLTTLKSLDDILWTLRDEYASVMGTKQEATRRADYSSIGTDLAKVKRLITAREKAIRSVKQMMRKGLSSGRSGGAVPGNI